MSLSLYLDVEETAGARIAAFIGGLGNNRKELHESIASEAFYITREHLIEIAATRHETAMELGAAPTKFWEDAVHTMSSNATNEAATVSIHSPGIGRAAHDVTIVPKDGARFLTIPVHPMAYGHRVSELRMEMDIFPLHTGPSGVGVLATRQPGQKIATALYLLEPEVHQDQDRTLLPSDEEYEEAAFKGIETYMRLILP